MHAVIYHIRYHYFNGLICHTLIVGCMYQLTVIILLQDARLQ